MTEYVYVYVYIYIYICVCVCIYIMYIYIYMYIYVYTYVYMYIHIYVCVCLCAYVCAYITHTDSIIYIYTSTCQWVPKRRPLGRGFATAPVWFHGCYHPIFGYFIFIPNVSHLGPSKLSLYVAHFHPQPGSGSCWWWQVVWWHLIQIH